ncbi:Hfq-related RNA-binding protein [Floridanema aerugineum]|jgi:host factor-I protein|uniref:RNA-binding protein hfq n=1 Tax=Floridaenema aerugineum BLCC-F46 TaxID=3153654 RepID=A0ABV4WZL0_9CYAN
MTSAFDTNLPSVRQVQSIIKSQKRVELKLLSGEVLSGILRWQDQNCLAIIDDSNQQTLVWRQSIAYLKAFD